MSRYVRLLLCVLFGAALCSKALAEPEADVLAVLSEAIGSKFSVLSYAVADLDQDGQQDWVGVLKIERTAGPSTRLYVLGRKIDGVKVAAMSREVAYVDCAGRCGVEILSAKAGNFLVRHYSRGGWGAAGLVTQFALRGSRWQVIGQKRTDVDAQLDREETTDTNLLTGEYKSVSATGGMSGDPKAARVKKGVRAKQKPLWLEAFDPVYF